MHQGTKHEELPRDQLRGIHRLDWRRVLLRFAYDNDVARGRRQLDCDIRASRSIQLLCARCIDGITYCSLVPVVQ